jgi:ankyrin repeat protein
MQQRDGDTMTNEDDVPYAIVDEAPFSKKMEASFSKKMNLATYLRIHSNASPSKLRCIIKNDILVNDDVDYLKRLVKDMGGMDYVFRFLWYDGPVPTISDDGTESGLRMSKGIGRTWIQYCCFYNAYRCLLWIFQTIGQEYGNQQSIIKNLLEFPSISYCGTNYVAIATLRNSYQCLSLLLEYGGLDPNMSINIHGSTAAHLAAHTDNVECLRVLQSGTYARFVVDSDDCYDKMSIPTTTSNGNDAFGNDRDTYNLDALSSSPMGLNENCKSWSADWNKMNSLGETPMHIAAKQGCERAMQFFLDVAITSATSLSAEVDSNEPGCDFSLRNIAGMDCAAIAAKHDKAQIISLISDSIERLLDLSFGLQDDLHPPTLPINRGILHNLQTGSEKIKLLAPSPNRSKALSEPQILYSSTSISTGRKLPQAPQEIAHHQQLPHYFPTLNHRNSLDEYNHELPIHVAARNGNCNAMEALLKSNNIDITSCDSLGQNVMHIAALNGHLNICQQLIKVSKCTSSKVQMKEFDVADHIGRTPLYIACSIGNPSLARLLVSISDWRVICHEQKKLIGPFSEYVNQPAMFAAVVNNDIDTVSVLLEYGVDVNQVDDEGRSAINIAAKLGHFRMCQKLIAHGADVNHKSTRGKHI